MAMRIAYLLLAFHLGGGIAVAGQQQVAPGISIQLSKRVETYNLRVNSFVEALAQVAGDFRIPIGIAWINKPSATGKLSFSWVGATVQEILDEIVATQSGYKIDVSNGVLRVTSTDIPPAQNFLRVRINQFDVQNGFLPVASRDLQNQVRVETNPHKAQTILAGSGSSQAVNMDEPRIDLQLKSTTVEEILNSLVLVSDRKVWVATFEDSFILTSSGFRQTISLWSEVPVPDDEQPVWDMFRWGEAIPTKGLRLN